MIMPHSESNTVHAEHSMHIRARARYIDDSYRQIEMR